MNANLEKLDLPFKNEWELFTFICLFYLLFLLEKKRLVTVSVIRHAIELRKTGVYMNNKNDHE